LRAVATGGAASPGRAGRCRATRGKIAGQLFRPGGGGGSFREGRCCMPGTFSQILYHIVFSTKYRKEWIMADLAQRLYPFIGGIIRAEKGMLYSIGGMPDHVHLYIRWRTDASVSDLMRTVKARSSGWVHDTFPELRPFAWQEGYSVFSVSK